MKKSFSKRLAKAAHAVDPMKEWNLVAMKLQAKIPRLKNWKVATK